MYRPDGKTIGHAEIKIGDTMIMLADEMPQARMLSPQSVGGTPFQLYMYVKDVDKVFNQALKAGATVTEPVMDMFYGDRTGQLMDPFGHLWGLATHMRDIPPKEMKKAAQDWYAQMGNQ